MASKFGWVIVECDECGGIGSDVKGDNCPQCRGYNSIPHKLPMFLLTDYVGTIYANKKQAQEEIESW